MIGSEGTLGFIAEITYKTVIEHPFKASSLMIFPNIEDACNAVSLLKSAPVSAVELMDRAGLRSVENQIGMPEYLKTLSPYASAILVETRAIEHEILLTQIASILNTVKNIVPEIPIIFTSIPSEYNDEFRRTVSMKSLDFLYPFELSATNCVDSGVITSYSSRLRSNVNRIPLTNSEIPSTSMMSFFTSVTKKSSSLRLNRIPAAILWLFVLVIRW